MKRLLGTAVAIVALLYVGIIAYVKLNERTLVFHAEKARGPLKEPQAPFTPPHERVTLASLDGTPLVGWVVPSATGDTARTWVLYFHGNSHNLSQFEEPEFYQYLRALGVNLLVVDPRGFGESGGTPDEAGAYLDARAAWDYLLTQRHAAPDRIIIYGHSLGTGLAVQLATQVDAGALILQAPYTSVPDMGALRYPFLPVRAVAGYRFPSLERMPQVHEPLLVMHSPADSTIPIAMGAAITRAAASASKLCVPIKGGHNIAFKADSATFFSQFKLMVLAVQAVADGKEHLAAPGTPVKAGARFALTAPTRAQWNADSAQATAAPAPVAAPTPASSASCG